MNMMLIAALCMAFVTKTVSENVMYKMKDVRIPEKHLTLDESVIFMGGMLFPNLTYWKFRMPEAHYKCYLSDGMAILITPKSKAYDIIHITGDIVMSGNDTANVLGFGWGMADSNDPPYSFNAFACWDGTPWTMYVAVGCWNSSAWGMYCP